jgi:hypothetical protein
MYDIIDIWYSVHVQSQINVFLRIFVDFDNAADMAMEHPSGHG